MPFKGKNNCEAVVVCAIHVVKRPSKRSVLVYIYMFICTELIEETIRLPGPIFGMWGSFGLARISSSLGKILTHLTKLGRNCHIFESVKSHKY